MERNAAQLRLEMLDFADALDQVRARLITIAQAHTAACVPAYTNGVQVMPISYGHYLMALPIRSPATLHASARPTRASTSAPWHGRAGQLQLEHQPRAPGAAAGV